MKDENCGSMGRMSHFLKIMVSSWYSADGCTKLILASAMLKIMLSLSRKRTR